MKSKPNSKTTHLYLIRHAATAANEQRPYILQGQGINKGLSETGQRQAVAVGQFLSDFAIDHIYASPMLRAMETASAIAEHHGLDIRSVEALVECNVGRWETMDWDSIMQKFPEEYRLFMENPAKNPYLDGESYGDVLARVQPAIGELLEQHQGESIVVIAHNVVNRAYLASFLGLELKHAKGIRLSNTGVNVLRYRDGETTLLTLNAVFHLEEEL